MKKKEESKVVPFPGLKDRLIERGLDLLQEQHHTEAIDLLSQAYAIDPTDAAGAVSLAVAYYEDRQLDEAKSLCEQLMKHGVGEYEEIVELYVLTLIQMREFDMVETTLNAIIDEADLPNEQKERFYHLRTLAVKQKKEERTAEQSIVLHKETEQQVIQLAQLAKQNIHPMKASLTPLLLSDDIHPFIKTLVLNIFREQQVSDEVSVTKWQETVTVRPAELTEPFEQPHVKDVLHAFHKKSDQSDPSVDSIGADLIQRHAFVLYPFSWQERNADLIAEAYEILAMNYLGKSEGWGDLEDTEIAVQIMALETDSIM